MINKVSMKEFVYSREKINDNTERIVCNNKDCCVLKCNIGKGVFNGPWKNKSMQVAGVFVIDIVTDSVLLVQSYHKNWGPPKGGIEEGENSEKAALRELREETGITVKKDELMGPLVLSCGTFYLLEFSKEKYDKNRYSEKITGTDITGVGWMSISCFKSNFDYITDIVNQSARYLVKNYNKFREKLTRKYEVDMMINININTLFLKSLRINIF